jgi:4-carboxymuconolactone decarboxylase
MDPEHPPGRPDAEATEATEAVEAARALAGRLDPAGLAVRRAVLGEEHVARSLAAADDFTADFQEFLTRYAWGGVWTRDGLDRRTRSCITLAVLTALHCTQELPLHVRGALNNGLTPEEIKEVLLHTAVYAGVPAANSAFAVARQTLDELGPGPGATGPGADPADLNP